MTKLAYRRKTRIGIALRGPPAGEHPGIGWAVAELVAIGRHLTDAPCFHRALLAGIDHVAFEPRAIDRFDACDRLDHGTARAAARGTSPRDRRSRGTGRPRPAHRDGAGRAARSAPRAAPRARSRCS